MCKDRKIIFVSNQPYTNRDYHRFGVKYLIDKQYKVELWEVINNNITDIRFTSGMYEGDILFKVEKSELDNRIKREQKSFFIYLGNEIEPTLFLAKNKVNYINYLYINVVPSVDKDMKEDKSKNMSNRIRWIKQNGWLGCLKIKCRRYINVGKNNVYRKIVKKNPPVCIITSTKEATKYFDKVFRESRIVYTHTMDYERYLEQLKLPKGNSKPFMVYVDSGYGSVVGDFVRTNTSDPIYATRDIYFQQLEEVFCNLEEKFKMPIVIAGHPHAVYDNKSFCGRKVVLGKTEELVRNSVLFITAVSTAINQAVLFDKDILILNNSTFKELENYTSFVLPYYKVLRLKECNMDIPELRKEPWKYITHLDEEVKKNFLHKYIKEEFTEPKLIIETVEEIIEKIWEEE